MKTTGFRWGGRPGGGRGRGRHSYGKEVRNLTPEMFLELHCRGPENYMNEYPIRPNMNFNSS